MEVINLRGGAQGGPTPILERAELTDRPLTKEICRGCGLGRSSGVLPSRFHEVNILERLFLLNDGFDVLRE